MDLELSVGNNYAILGANGSGKSTLLQVIAGNQLASEGKISYFSSKDPSSALREISAEEIYTQLSLASPYLELIEEFTLDECVRFHGKFKKFRNGLGPAELIEAAYLTEAKNKNIKDLSSGMKQRVRLALAILGDTPLLLLDEPCSNLDARGVEWYKKLVADNKADRLIIVCSNEQKDEYEFCEQQIRLEDHKP